MSTNEKLVKGREAFRKKLWDDAYAILSDVDNTNTLEPEDLEYSAIAAYLSGKSTESNNIWNRAHTSYLNENNLKGAIRCAFWLGMTLLNKGESARGGGWIARARRILNETGIDCVEEGYLKIPLGLKHMADGDIPGAISFFEQAGKIAMKFNDPDLSAFSLLGKGQGKIRAREIHDGVSLLDEVMASVESGEVSAIVSGIVYCAVIEACMEIFDLQRAHEWTEALSDWCESQPHLVPFRGQCLTRRSQILQLHGNWTDALEEASRASEILSGPHVEPAAGEAFYQAGDLHRLRGDYENAKEAYNQANKYGRNPQPGLALLRLAEGKTEAAVNSISFTMKETLSHKNQAKILPAYIEIILAAGDTGKARNAVQNLIEIASGLDAPYLKAMGMYSEGILLLSEKNGRVAFDKLLEAEKIWKNINDPYQTARTRTMKGIACRISGDEDTARFELESAKHIFERLGAGPDQEKVNELLEDKAIGKSRGLSKRELEVLQHLSQGKSNKTIANELFISERTVERHLSNIFNKLEVSSRSEAVAYAFRHQIL